MHNLPSKLTISMRLGLDSAQASQKVRTIMENHRSGLDKDLTICLSEISDIIGGYGLEIIRSGQDTQHKFNGLSYVNMGDTYACTVIFDHAKRQWLVCSYGDLVETDNGKRFI